MKAIHCHTTVLAQTHHAAGGPCKLRRKSNQFPCRVCQTPWQACRFRTCALLLAGIQSSYNGSVARFCGDGGRNGWICFGPKPRPHSQTLWSPFLVCCMHLGTSLGSWRAPNKPVLHCDICRIQDNVGNLGQAGRRHQAGALGREHIDGLLSSCLQDARNATSRASRGKSLHMPRPRNHISKNIT